MGEKFQIKTDGDLEAVVLAESYDLLSSVVGPYMYEVSGRPGEQQAMFGSAEILALFYIRVHEFLAKSSNVSSIPSIREVSLFSGGRWICERYPDEAKEASLDEAHSRAAEWLDQVHRIVCWSGSIWRHLRLELPMKTLIAMRANLEKHQLLKLDREIRRLRSKCAASGCNLTLPETIFARQEFEDHLRGMLEYHSTEVAEVLGRYFFALYRFVRGRYCLRPTNHLDVIQPPEGVTDEVFRYMYASTIVRFSSWSESRILSSIPETASCFKRPYPQHQAWSAVETEETAT